MTEVHYFPRYSQRENFITNNSLLLMYRLYDWNRHRFQRFLAQVLNEKADAPIAALGLQISQQVGTRASILDGYLDQASLRIAIETKSEARAFDSDQLSRHLTGFESGKSGYLLLLSPEKANLNQASWNELHKAATKKNVTVAAITFEDLIASFRTVLKEHDEDMLALLEDYEAFCSEENLLRTDDETIFVPPCGQSLQINIDCKLYFCPAHWSRRNTRYLGLYADKRVQKIGVITKLAYCELSGTDLSAQDSAGAALLLTTDESERIRKAIEAAKNKNDWSIKKDHKFFLCDSLFDTEFAKESPGGIMGHRYLRLSEYLQPVPQDVAQLANELRRVRWK